MYKEVEATPLLTLAAYEALDCVGALLTFSVHGVVHPGLYFPSRRDCKLLRLIVIDASAQAEEYRLHLFGDMPLAAARTDADAYAPIAADLAHKMTTLLIETADYQVSAGDSIAVFELDHAIVLQTEIFYGVLESIATPDYVADDDLLVKFVIEV